MTCGQKMVLEAAHGSGLDLTAELREHSYFTLSNFSRKGMSLIVDRPAGGGGEDFDAPVQPSFAIKSTGRVF